MTYKLQVNEGWRILTDERGWMYTVWELDANGKIRTALNRDGRTFHIGHHGKKVYPDKPTAEKAGKRHLRRLEKAASIRANHDQPR